MSPKLLKHELFQGLLKVKLISSLLTVHVEMLLDGRRPSLAWPERPARPPPWGAAIAARTRTRTRCGRRGRGSGMRAEILGHGAQRKVQKRVTWTAGLTEYGGPEGTDYRGDAGPGSYSF